MTFVETVLTPELAAQLLAKPHPLQRRIDRQTVARYGQAITDNRWRLVPDPIQVAGEEGMFNGGHRCSAVIATGIAIPVYIDWNADPVLFDLIDVGRGRAAYQFISEKNAATRAAAARVTLWYEQRFQRALQAGPTTRFDLEQVLTETIRRAVAFEVMMPAARMTYQYTSLPESLCLAVYAIAHELDLGSQVEDFVQGITEPQTRANGDPARLLAERFRRQDQVRRRRRMTDDWTILVRALNWSIEGLTAKRLQLGECWPRVAESEADFSRRRNALANSRLRDNDGPVNHAKDGTK